MYNGVFLSRNGSIWKMYERINQACRDGDVELVQALIQDGFDVTSNDNYAVQLASLHGNIDIIKLLIEHGADVTSNDNRALIWASENGQYDVVNYLLEVCDL